MKKFDHGGSSTAPGGIPQHSTVKAEDELGGAVVCGREEHGQKHVRFKRSRSWSISSSAASEHSNRGDRSSKKVKLEGGSLILGVQRDDRIDVAELSAVVSPFCGALVEYR